MPLTSEHWPPPDLANWLEEVKNRPEDEWLIPGLIPADAISLISGRAKVGHKTWLAFILTLGLVLGRSPIPLFQPRRKVKALVIELEEPAKQTLSRWQKLLAFFDETEMPRDCVYFSHRAPLLVDDAADLSDLCTFIRERGIEFVVIDTFVKSHTLDENSTRDVAAIMRRYDEIRAAMYNKGSILLCHHLRKPSDRPSDIDDELRGSSALSGHYDSHLAVRKRREDSLSMVVRQKMDEDRLYSMKWAIDSTTARLAVAEILKDGFTNEYLEQCYDEIELEDMGYTLNMLASLWGIEKTTAASVRRALEKRGWLETTGEHGRRKKVKRNDQV